MTSHAAHETAVVERVRPRDLVLFAVTAALLVALPWMLVSAGSEPVSYRDSQGMDAEAPAWVGVLVLFVPLLGWSGLKAFHLLRGPAAAVVGPGGIKLFPEAVGGLYLRDEEPDVDLPWDEVERVVLWRIRRKWLWFVPVWESRVGVEKTTDWYGVSQREPTAKQRRSREARPDGSPVRLGAMLNARSVRLAPRGARAIAAAAARFAPGVAVVDERFFGRPQVVEVRPGRDRRRY
ncbi:hypothetical protein LO763_19205 [Glycomyces sp. A-F 0318]|uniref:hypothetical protein n=1 Tax=Glycomyces amatae TaxID=2881355 RepID=UPI001E2B0407|nr:hypothetical protein [Glycomyces amatae]MCD0445740.1 hypothetical protein [Glycomyces amatae]